METLPPLVSRPSRKEVVVVGVVKSVGASRTDGIDLKGVPAVMFTVSLVETGTETVLFGSGEVEVIVIVAGAVSKRLLAPVKKFKLPRPEPFRVTAPTVLRLRPPNEPFRV